MFLKKNNSQLGRTLLEMLSVLALIAILSIGAIAGYSYALTKNKTNVLINDVKTLAILTLSSNFLARNPIGTTITADETTTSTPAPITYTITKESSKTFYVTAVKVSYDVCHQLQKESILFIERLSVNPDTLGVCETYDNNILFYMNDDLSTTDSNPDDKEFCDASTPCGECGECVNGLCQDNDAKCTDGHLCVNGTCSGCPVGQFETSSGTCVSCTDKTAAFNASLAECRKCPSETRISIGTECRRCDQIAWVNASLSDCKKCSKLVYFGTDNRWGVCTNTCAYPTPTPSTKGMCEQCPNRYFTGANDLVGMCDFCNGIVTNNGRTCIPKDQCQPGYVHNSSYVCVECSDKTGFYAMADECRKCPNDTNFLGSYCHSCVTSVWIGTTKEDCAKCSNRVYMNGKCGMCTSPEPTRGTKAECGQCPNRYFDGTNDATGNCRLCNGIVSSDGRSCEVTPCAPELVTSLTGLCFPCTNFLTTAVSESECAKCPDTRYFGQSGCMACGAGQKSTKAACERCGILNFFGEDSENGRCDSCLSSNVITSTKEQCGKCPERYFTGSDDQNGECRYCEKTVSSDGRKCT